MRNISCGDHWQLSFELTLSPPANAPSTSHLPRNAPSFFTPSSVGGAAVETVQRQTAITTAAATSLGMRMASPAVQDSGSRFRGKRVIQAYTLLCQTVTNGV